MVEIKTNAAPRFLSQPDPSARLIVVAGRDRGKVKEAAKDLQNAWLGQSPDPLNISVFQGSEWRADPQRIVEAAMSPSLLGGKRLIRVLEGDKALGKSMELWLDSASLAPEALIVVEAGDLAKADALRKLATKSPSAAMLFFYADESGDVAGLVRQVLVEQNGFQVDSDAMALLQQNLGGDRAVSRGELEKLALYAVGSTDISIEHVSAVISDAAGLEFEALTHAVSLGDFNTLDREFHRLIEAGENPNAIMSIVRNHFGKLVELRFLIDGGLNFAAASSQMRPPLFWKSKSKFEAGVSKWSAPKLDQARARILDGFVDLRTTGRPESETAQRVLFALASMARAAS